MRYVSTRTITYAVIAMGTAQDTAQDTAKDIADSGKNARSIMRV